jgi:DNA-binding response OmpR family regulator
VYVLVVEDDPSVRDMLVLTLADEGYDVEHASDGGAALALAALRRPDVILLDMKMPRADGWEFARRYRAQTVDPAPIMLLTAARDAAAWAAEVDAQSYLAKPFELDELLAMIVAVTRPAPE